MARIIRTSAAEADLASIWSYIANDNLTAADKLLTQIDAAFDLLGKTPELGFSVEEIKPSVRCKPVKRNHLIFYQLMGDEIFILRVLHAATPVRFPQIIKMAIIKASTVAAD